MGDRSPAARPLRRRAIKLVSHWTARLKKEDRPAVRLGLGTICYSLRLCGAQQCCGGCSCFVGAAAVLWGLQLCVPRVPFALHSANMTVASGI